MPETILLTVQQAAEMSGMSGGAIRRACANGELACLRIGKAKRLIHRDVFDAYLHGTVESVPEQNSCGIRRV
ncbi:MAG: DNA-binding protein [Clostridia bacterium]|nr:DNA-binding protein [Clostridia bacterium]